MVSNQNYSMVLHLNWWPQTIKNVFFVDFIGQWLCLSLSFGLNGRDLDKFFLGRSNSFF
eukprot:UN09006